MNNPEQQQVDYQQNYDAPDQTEQIGFDNANNSDFNSGMTGSESQNAGDHQHSNDASQFAMDVNLNSFEGFSQVQEQQEAAQESAATDEQNQGRRQFRNRPNRGPGGEEEDEKDILNKIFIGGIHPETSEDSLKEHFAKFGTIVDHVIIKDPTTKRSRGFGFVKYSESSAVDEVSRFTL